MLLILGLIGRQKQVSHWVQGKPGLHREFRDSHSYTEKKSVLDK